MKKRELRILLNSRLDDLCELYHWAISQGFDPAHRYGPPPPDDAGTASIADSKPAPAPTSWKSHEVEAINETSLPSADAKERKVADTFLTQRERIEAVIAACESWGTWQTLAAMLRAALDALADDATLDELNTVAQATAWRAGRLSQQAAVLDAVEAQ